MRSARPHLSRAGESKQTDSGGEWPPFRRVLLLHEPGRATAGAIEVARGLVEQEHAALTVVAVVPQAPSGPRCGGSALEYNRALRESAERELEQAREALGEQAAHATFELLVEGVDPPLAAWCAASGFDLILLPARRRPLRLRGHPDASRLRGQTAAEVRIVDGRGAG
jgi:nucleotide-binding universal stress UspA family protein